MLAIAFHPTRSERLASVGGNGTCKIKIPTRAGCIWAIAFTPDGTQLCSGAQDGKICRWDIDSGKKVDSNQPKRLYEGLSILDATGLTTAQLQSLERLGARA